MSIYETVEYLKGLVGEQLSTATKLGTTPNVGKVSIALGIIEAYIISDMKIPDPDSLDRMIQVHYKTLQDCATNKIQLTADMDTREKITELAHFVWSTIRGSKKDIIHAQHVYTFTKHLNEGKKTQLCCAGVTMTVLSLAQCLSNEHDDLKKIRLVITEDHCLLSLTGTCDRGDLAEVTTESRIMRGKPPEEREFCSHWLYAGGRPTVCDPCQAITACIVSMNYLKGSKKSNVISESLFNIQQSLLEHLYENKFPMYPNAISKVASMKEESQWFDVETCCKSIQEALEQFDKTWDGIRRIFKAAIHVSTGNEWYPMSSLATSYSYEHELLQLYFKSMPESNDYDRMLRCVKYFMAIVRRGSEVCSQYRYSGKHDEELLKDIDDIISKMTMMLNASYSIDSSLIDSVDVCADLVRTFDLLLLLFSGKTLPSKWSKSFLECLKLFSKETRRKAMYDLSLTTSTLSERKEAIIEYKKSVLLQTLEAPCLDQDDQGRRKRTRN